MQRKLSCPEDVVNATEVEQLIVIVIGVEVVNVIVNLYIIVRSRER
jgi:hypothetical protein